MRWGKKTQSRNITPPLVLSALAIMPAGIKENPENQVDCDYESCTAFSQRCQTSIVKLQAVSRLKRGTAREERRRLSGTFSLHRHCLGSAMVGPGLAAMNFGAGESGGSNIQKLHMQRPACTKGACFRR